MVRVNVKKEVKTVDNQGRYVIPKKWIKEHVKDRTIKVEISDEKIIIKPNVPVDIRHLFGSIKTDLGVDETDWHIYRAAATKKGLKKKENRELV